MATSTEKALTAAIIVGLCAWSYQTWFLRPDRQRKEHEERRAEASQRFIEWARIAKEKEIATGETIKLVVIPSPLGHELSDTKCLIYTNRELKTSSMICPDANQDDLVASE